MPSIALWRTEERVVTTMTDASVREFKMPDVGEGLTEAEILKWYVQPGDTVTDGQVVCEVETAKAAVELPIPYDGVVRELRFPEGTTVDVGTSIIAVDVTGGAAPVEAPAPEEAPVEAKEEAKPAARTPVLVGYGVATSSTKRRPRKGAEIPPQEVAAAVQAELNGHATGTAVQQRPLAKPPVRKLAKDLGVDLATVTPSGPDGVITREDVHAAVAPAAEPASAPVAPRALAPRWRRTTRRVRPYPGEGRPQGDGRGDGRLGVHGTACHGVRDGGRDAHDEAGGGTQAVRRVRDAGSAGQPAAPDRQGPAGRDQAQPGRQRVLDEAAQEDRPQALREPGYRGGDPRGLIVAEHQGRSHEDAAATGTVLGELVSTARDGKTSPAAMQGGTVTITNVGVFGVDTGTPILNPGESAILAVGAIKLQPWVHKGKVKPRQVTTLALSFDHRLVDGSWGQRCWRMWRRFWSSRSG